MHYKVLLKVPEQCKYSSRTQSSRQPLSAFAGRACVGDWLDAEGLLARLTEELLQLYKQ